MVLLWTHLLQRTNLEARTAASLSIVSPKLGGHVEMLMVRLQTHLLRRANLDPRTATALSIMPPLLLGGQVEILMFSLWTHLLQRTLGLSPVGCEDFSFLCFHAAHNKGPNRLMCRRRSDVCQAKSPLTDVQVGSQGPAIKTASSDCCVSISCTS